MHSCHHLNTPAGGFSIERQWDTQLSTFLFNYDKLKLDLICARQQVLNQCLEQGVYLGAKASGLGERGRHPFTEITQNVVVSLSLSPSPAMKLQSAIVVYVTGCRGIRVIYGSCAQMGILGLLFTFSSLKPWHQTYKSTQTHC